MSGAERSSLAERWRNRSGPPSSGSIRQLWQWLADPARADAERLWLVGSGRSAGRSKGGQVRPGPDPVTEWLPLITCLLDHESKSVRRGRHEAAHPETPAAASEQDPQEQDRGGRQSAATLVLAVLRGLLLDLLATGDLERVQRAFDMFALALEAISEAAENG
jgi:hypothetical protein